MAVDKVIHENEHGLPLNGVCWLETHHSCKCSERTQMIRQLNLKAGSLVVDAGCGPGMWTPLLAEAIGPRGRIIGVDIAPEVLVTAQKRSMHSWYRHQVRYKCASLDQLPLEHGEADVVFSANVSQYLPDPAATFATLGRYLRDGGLLAVKDIDFGTLCFSNIDTQLQERVYEARRDWEIRRVLRGYSFEDSWVGSKLAGYMLKAGYQDVRVQKYRIVRHYPLAEDFRTYLQGVGEWFVCEGAPYLSRRDVAAWLNCFLDERHCVFNDPSFSFEETEYMVTGTWRGVQSYPRCDTAVEEILCAHL